jgi:hypothetical protein
VLVVSVGVNAGVGVVHVPALLCARAWLSKPRAPNVEEATLPDKENADQRSYGKEDIEGASGRDVLHMESKYRDRR